MMRPRWVLVLFGLPFLAPATAWPHASLVKSDPPRRAVLSQGPARVQLWFDKRVEGAFSRLGVFDGEGRQVDLGDIRIGPDDPKKVSVGVPFLAPGTYTAKFRVLSVDGHITESQLSFFLRESR